MQFLKIAKDLTLSALSSVVGERNVDSVLNANSMERSVNIGKAFYDRVTTGTVDYQKKMNILNQFVGDSDLFEKAALGSEDDWKVLSQYNCFSDAMRIPEEVKLPSSEGVLGNGDPVSDSVYRKCMEDLKNSHVINPATFAEYNASYSGNSFGVTSDGRIMGNEMFQWFKLPWGEVCLYSSLNDDMLYFPVYPEGWDDGATANYEEMGEMLYQYEPWFVYKSSGPREISFTFEFHRDMWTGDHRDGNANALIRGCEANCFPRYEGSLVNAPLVTMYIHGQNLITGIMTDCKKSWSGPIGLDGFYLVCELSITIKEVSPEKLNYDVVKGKRLIQ